MDVVQVSEFDCAGMRRLTERSTAARGRHQPLTAALYQTYKITHNVTSVITHHTVLFESLESHPMLYRAPIAIKLTNSNLNFGLKRESLVGKSYNPNLRIEPRFQCSAKPLISHNQQGNEEKKKYRLHCSSLFFFSIR